MYTYKRAVGVSKSLPRGEELLDIGALTTKQIVKEYNPLKIVLQDLLYNREVTMDLIDYTNEFTSFVGTIQEWLNTKSSTPLITSNKIPGEEYRYVQIHDIQYKWFTLYPGNVKMSEDRQDMLDTADSVDIRVIKTDRTKVDYKALTQRSLWLFNGHLTRAVADDKALYLLNAGKHYLINDNSHACSLNFNTVSTLNTYPIEKGDVHFEDHDTFKFVHVTAKDSFKGKTVWMSIGGRLYLPDVVPTVSDRTVAIQTEKVDWFSAIFNSKKLIDLSSVIDPEREVVPANFFSTKDFWENLLSDPSSFFIVLDNPNVYVTKKPIVTYNYPFTYYTEETRNIPLLTGDGLLPKYFTRKITTRRLLDTDIGTEKIYLNKTTGVTNGGKLYHGLTNRFAPSKLSAGYLLYIRSVLQKD